MNHVFPIILSATLAAVAATSQIQDPRKIPARPQVQNDNKPQAATAIKTAVHTQPARSALGALGTTQPTKIASTDLPAGATSMSTDVLFDDRANAVYALGNTYKAEFDQSGAAYVPYFGGADRNYPLHFAVRTAVVANTELAVKNAMPTRDGKRVTFDHGGLRATYDLLPRGMEQMFWFDSLPVRGELLVEVGLTTELQAAVHADGLSFANALGTVSYGQAFAIDARGERVVLATTLEQGTLRFHVPSAFVASAQLPLCIDPLVSSSQLAYQGFNPYPAEVSDIAYEPSYGEYQVVFHRYWSGTDYDAFVRRFDSNMTPTNLVVIDTSTAESWEKPKIAANNLADRFLVVAQTSNGHASPFWIAGRTIDSGSGLVGSPFTIERAGIPGHAFGDKINPDVGGDPDYFGPTYFTVVWERIALTTDHDVHVKQVTSTGSLVSPVPIYLANSTAFDSQPTISKSNGAPPYATQCWGVAWQRTYSPSDEDIYGALVRWDGVVTVPPFVIDSPIAWQLHPSISSPTDEVNGARYYLCTFDDQLPANSTITGTVLDQTGASQGRFDIANQLTPTYPHVEPSVDSDGARFVVGWHEVYGGTGQDFDIRVATCAYSPALGLVIQDQATPGYTIDLESLCEVTSTHADGSGAGRYGVTWTRRTTNGRDIYARSYDGVQSGATFSTRATSCGTAADFTVLGAPYLGGFVYAAQAVAGGIRGYVFGTPTSLPIGPCPGCTLGVQGDLVLLDPLTIAVPNEPTLVGLTFAMQGFEFGSGTCLGAISLSDTLDFTVR